MKNNMERTFYETRVVPFIVYREKNKNGKISHEPIDNLTREEIRNMSCDPRMFWKDSNHMYIAEEPLVYNEGTGVKMVLFYVFDELTKDEQARFFDRSIIIHTTIKDVVQVYGESSKRFFGKKKTKSK